MCSTSEQRSRSRSRSRSVPASQDDRFPSGRAASVTKALLYTRSMLIEMKHSAGISPRRRFAELLHRKFYERRGLVDHALESAAARDVQRFLNVLGKGSYVMPHVHPEEGKWEVFVHVDGAFNVLALEPSIPVDDATNTLESVQLSMEVPIVFVNQGCWHCIAALDKTGAVEFEFKPGPYGGVAKDKIFSHQLEKPWGYDEADEKVHAVLPRYVRDLESAAGTRAAAPGLPGSSYSMLRPYTRTELLAMLSTSDRQEFCLVETGPGEVKPKATIIAVQPGTGRECRVCRDGWIVYAWLAGDAVTVGSFGRLGPDAPLIELDTAEGADLGALDCRLVANGSTGGVVLELRTVP